MMTTIFLILLVQFVHFTPIFTTSEFAFVISQQGANQVTNFTLTQGVKLLKKPLNLLVKSSEETSRHLASVDLKHQFSLENVTLDLKENLIGVRLQNIGISSETNVFPEIWPFTTSHESIEFNVTLKNTYLGISTENTLRLVKCNISDHRVKSTAKNYWVVKGGAKLVSSYLDSHFEGLICPNIGVILGVIQSLLAASIPLTNFVAKEALPPNLQNVNLRYDCTGIRVQQGHLAAGVAIKWERLVDNATQLAGNSSDTSRLDLEFGDTNGHHVTLWIHEGVVNDLLSLFDWDFEIINADVPLTDENIPESSRNFLSTLCDYCFFRLNVYNRGPPYIRAVNNTIALERYDTVRLAVVNPNKNATAMFVSFILFFDGQVVPYIDEGTVKAKVDLLNASIDMKESAFPIEWAGFMEELVRGMIIGMIWPQIKTGVESITNVNGIPLPSSCGLDPNSMELKIADGKFGLSTDLQLSDFDLGACAHDLQSALPNPEGIFGAR